MKVPFTKSSGKRVRGGTLLILSILLVGSAIMRLGMQAGPAFARDADVDVTPHVAEQDHESGAPVAADMEQLLIALRQREDLVKTREIQIEDRMKALEIADAAIEAKLAALIEAEESLSATLALADGATEQDLTGLTAVYEKMKPKDSAALFETMDPAFAAGFLGRMRPESAAGILAKLSPQAAYSISVILAGRNASVPTQ